VVAGGGVIYTFDRFEDFQAKARELGITSDLQNLQSLDVLFYEQYPEYLLFSLVSFETGINKIVVLTKKDSLIYPSLLFKSDQLLKIRVKGQYKESTIAAYMVLKKMTDNYYDYFESINREIIANEAAPIREKLEILSRRMRRLQEIADDFTALLIRIKGSEVPFIDTQKIGYDYDLLLARAKHLIHRCASSNREIARLYTFMEMRSTTELNKRIERLTEIMKKLTAITVVLMLPTIITSHYGMNFKYMPELAIPEAYPIVTLFTILIVIFTAIFFRYKGWL